MLRGQIMVREARREDAAALIRLWAGLLPRPVAEPAPASDQERVALSVERHAVQPDTSIVVAEVDGQIAGCAYLRVGLVSPLDAEPAVHVSHLQVDAATDASAADVGTGLLDAALGWAEEQGIGTLTAGSAATDRDTNRFLARLGLGQVGVLRATTVPALRARMLRDQAAAPRGIARRTGQVVAMRRSQRRARTGDVAL